MDTNVFFYLLVDKSNLAKLENSNLRFRVGYIETASIDLEGKNRLIEDCAWEALDYLLKDNFPDAKPYEIRAHKTSSNHGLYHSWSFTSPVADIKLYLMERLNNE